MKAAPRWPVLIVTLLIALAPTPSLSSPSSAPVARPPLERSAVRAVAGTLEVHFINVGQGNATLVVAPSGKTMLVDTGELRESARVASYLQSVLGGKALDYVVISHYHADHFGSFTDLLRNQGVTVGTATYDRGGDRSEYNSSIYGDYYDFCTSEQPDACKRATIREGDAIDLGAGLTAQILCAGDLVLRQACGESIISENDNSILILVSGDFLRVWIGGDTSGDVEHRFYADVETAAVNLGRIGNDLDVYGVDHHGSCRSSNQNLVDATLPTVSVFSLGLNPYGHPCPGVVDRLTVAGSTLYYTEDSSGAVVDGDVVVSYVGGHSFTVTGVQGPVTFSTKT